MSLLQEDLPEISRQHYNVADTLARKNVSRSDLRITNLYQDEIGRIIWVSPLAGELPLHGLTLLGKVREMDTYRAHRDRSVTDSNIITVARIGGFATRQIHEQAHQRALSLSAEALNGIHGTLETVNKKMRFAFEAMARLTPSDREAVFFMAAITRRLQDSR